MSKQGTRCAFFWLGREIFSEIAEIRASHEAIRRPRDTQNQGQTHKSRMTAAQFLDHYIDAINLARKHGLVTRSALLDNLQQL